MSSLASYIDHTCLKPDATKADIEKLCKEAIQHQFRAVCIHSSHVPLAVRILLDTKVLVCSVIGFPLGASLTEAKVFETKLAIKLGAKEIDMVLPIGALKEKDLKTVSEDIHEVVLAAENAPVKVILETCLLTQEEKIIGCSLIKASGAAFVKTSTGFSSSGATVEDITLLRKLVGKNFGVKASGGIRTKEDALRMIEAGANCIGTSASVTIVNS